jgi:polysaccharide biosynthesis/export protein
MRSAPRDNSFWQTKPAGVDAIRFVDRAALLTTESLNARMKTKRSLMASIGRTKRRVSASVGATLGLLIAGSLIGGCASNQEHGDTKGGADAGALSPEECAGGAAIQSAVQSGADEHTYMIQPGDELAVDFYLNPEFNDQVTVGPDGKISLRLIGAVQAAGTTPPQLAQEIDQKYTSELRAPDAVVHVRNMPERQVYVQGEVNKPGAFQLATGMTALQAIADAGGVTQDADDGSVVLIRRDACGRPAGQRLDVASAIKNPGNGEDAALMPYDVLVVPRSRIADIDLFVQHYVKNLIPVQPYFPIP